MTDIQGLVLRLPLGWTAKSTILDEFLRVWETDVGPIRLNESDIDYADFTADLGIIRLRGMDSVRCLLVTGYPRSPRRTVKAFIDKAKAPGQAILVIALSTVTHEDGQRHAGKLSQFGLIGKSDLSRLFPGTGSNWRFLVAGAFRRNSSRLGLVPFRIDLAAPPNMFFGRAHELERLVEEESINFAISGPGKIGKTSLVRQYMHQLVRLGRSSRVFYVDLHETTDRSRDSWPAFVARQIAGTSWSQKVTLETFPQFLKLFKSKITDGVTPTIILDEMDEILTDAENMKQILAAVEKKGLCRFVLCGKKEVYKAVRNNSTGLGGRFRLIRLEAFDEETGRKLLMEPLEDLSLKLAEESRSVDYVMEWTGRLPQLIQFYGQRMVESAVMEKSLTAISHEMIEKISHDFETKQYFLSPFDDLGSALARVLTYCVVAARSSTIGPEQLAVQVRGLGLELETEDIRRLCDELVILNLLAWENDQYRIANQAMRYYLTQSGTLDLEIQKALTQHRQRSSSRT